jgi:hypothetical protein
MEEKTQSGLFERRKPEVGCGRFEDNSSSQRQVPAVCAAEDFPVHDPLFSTLSNLDMMTVTVTTIFHLFDVQPQPGYESMRGSRLRTSSRQSAADSERWTLLSES